MIPIYRMSVIHIEVTNACNLACSNCTRFVGHHKKPYFMPLDQIEKAIDSLAGFTKQIGIMGGEPTLHPDFEQICLLLQKKVPKERRELWTNGLNWAKHERIINETFKPELITYNDHSDTEVGVHQPLLIAIKDVIKDRSLKSKLIHNCWVQWRWGASITKNGGFFCEVAAALDELYGLNCGFNIEPGWWNKNPNDFLCQVEKCCELCGAAIPMEGVSSHADYDLVSKTNLEKLKKIGSKKKCKLYNKQLSKKQIIDNLKGWTPWSHRPYKQSSPTKKWI